jgi:hypothetical protein
VRVLLIESEAGDADRAADLLAAAGHQVARCHDRGAEAFPCYDLIEGRTCPLEQDDVDVALLVRREALALRTPHEDGVRCALRRYVPLALAGDVRTSPYRDWAAAETDDVDQVVDVIARAVAAPLARHTDAARRSFAAVLEHCGFDGTGAAAEVFRSGPDLRVTLRAGQTISREAADIASVRAAGAVRDVDPYPRVIDVSVEGVS